MKQLTLLFLIQDDYVLLAMKKRGFGAGRWNGVGGKLDEGETIEQALVRECQEEINITPLQYEKVAEIIFHEQHEGTKNTLQVHVFITRSWQGEPTETEEMAPQWFPITDIPYTEMWPDDPFWLPQVLAGKKLRAEFELDEHDRIVIKQVAEIEAL